MDDPIDDVIRRLQDWTPPAGTTRTDFELELRALHGGSKHYFRRSFDPARYIVRADPDSAKRRR